MLQALKSKYSCFRSSYYSYYRSIDRKNTPVDLIGTLSKTKYGSTQNWNKGEWFNVCGVSKMIETIKNQIYEHLNKVKVISKENQRNEVFMVMLSKYILMSL